MASRSGSNASVRVSGTIGSSIAVGTSIWALARESARHSPPAAAHSTACKASARHSSHALQVLDHYTDDRPFYRASGLAAAVLEASSGQAKVPTGKKPKARPGSHV